MSNILNFSVDNYQILEEDPYIMLVKLFVVSVGGNLHKTYFSEEDIIKYAPSLMNKPLISIFTNGSLKEHARNAIDFENQKCIGCVPETNFFQIEEYKGQKWLTVHAVIWKHYANKNLLKELIDNQNSSENGTHISMEIENILSHKDETDGLAHITEFRFMAISIISNMMQEAVVGANAKIIKYSTIDYDSMVVDINKQLSQFSIPESIKENAKQALALKQKNPQLINFAKEIVNNDKLSFSKVNWILNKIQNLKKEDNIIFFGGIESKQWCENIIEQFNIENKKEKEDDIMIEKAVEKFSLTSNQIRDILDNALSEYKYKCGEYEYKKYWVNTYDEDYVYIEDNETYKNYRTKYSITDLIATIDMDSLEEGIRGGFTPIGETVDTTDYKAKFEEMSVKFDDMCGKYSTLEKDTTEKYSTFEELVKFKADTVKADLEGKANELYSKYTDYISDEEKTDLNIKLFSVENFDIFKEKVFAVVAPKIEAENIALKQNSNTDDVNKIQFSTMPMLNINNGNENKTSLDKLKEYANS